MAQNNNSTVDPIKQLDKAAKGITIEELKNAAMQICNMNDLQMQKTISHQMLQNLSTLMTAETTDVRKLATQLIILILYKNSRIQEEFTNVFGFTAVNNKIVINKVPDIVHKMLVKDPNLLKKIKTLEENVDQLYWTFPPFNNNEDFPDPLFYIIGIFINNKATQHEEKQFKINKAAFFRRMIPHQIMNDMNQSLTYNENTNQIQSKTTMEPQSFMEHLQEPEFQERSLYDEDQLDENCGPIELKATIQNKKTHTRNKSDVSQLKIQNNLIMKSNQASRPQSGSSNNTNSSKQKTLPLGENYKQTQQYLTQQIVKTQNSVEKSIQKIRGALIKAKVQHNQQTSAKSNKTPEQRKSSQAQHQVGYITKSPRPSYNQNQQQKEFQSIASRKKKEIKIESKAPMLSPMQRLFVRTPSPILKDRKVNNLTDRLHYRCQDAFDKK